MSNKVGYGKIMASGECIILQSSVVWSCMFFSTGAASLYIEDKGVHFTNSCSVLCFLLNLQSAASCFIQYSQFFKALKRELLISS